MIPENMEIISPLTSTALPDEYAAYIDVLEKTNQQLSLWFNPYGVMVGALSVLVALGAIAAAIFIYILGKDFKDKTNELLETVKSKADNILKLKNERALESEIVNEKMLKDAESKDVLATEVQEKIDVAKREKKVEVIERVPLKSLIKPQSLNFIYWYASDGIRYSFPTMDIFNSWFPPTNFQPTILTISDAQTANIPLGGNVPYKAGTRLLKTAGDPKIYAVAHHGILRWVRVEELLPKIFGSTWMQKLVTVPDALFVDYKIGETINDVSDYSPALEMKADKLK